MMNRNIDILNIKKIYAHQLFNKDILLMKKLNIFSSAAEISNRILSGDFYKLPSIQYLQGKAITFQSPKNEDIEVDIDGECFGTLPLTISVCHEAIRLMVPEASLTL